jgi:hypothetical protein
MHATAVLPADPAPIRRPTVSLTLKGYAVLALIHQQDALDIADVASRDRLDREISALMDID